MANISGVWKWLGYPNGQLDAWSNRYTTEINFKSNMEHFSTLGLETNAVGVTEVFYDGVAVFQAHVVISPDDPNAYDVQTTINEAYLVMDFGEEQTIDDDIYDFIVQNAQPYELLIADKLAQISRNEQKVFDAGKKAEYDAFWDAYQDYGAKNKYEYSFGGFSWNDDTFKPKYDLILGSGYTGTSMFIQSCITDLTSILKKQGVRLDTTLCGYMQGMFQGSKIKRIPELNCSNAMAYSENGLYMTFIGSQVETIDKLIVPENLKYVSTFQSCTNLKNIVFEGEIGNNIDFQHCKQLTAASIESIVNALSSTASGKSITFSKKAVDVAFGWYVDGEFHESGSVSGAWDELVASKSNWNIILAT